MNGPTLVNLVHFNDDRLVIEVPVEFRPGDPVQTLVGATAIASAKPRVGATVVGTVSIDDVDNIVEATFAPGSLAVGTYEFQLQVTASGIPRTIVAGHIRSRLSL